MVTGAIPGLGKTSLSRHVAATLRATHSVELFEEERIFQRAEFEDVVLRYRDGRKVALAVLRAAVRQYASTCVRSGTAVFVQDMLFPFLPSLLAWGYTDAEIRGFFTDLADSCADLELMQVHLDGPSATALARAGRREGPEWTSSLAAKVARYADVQVEVPDFAALVAYFDEAASRSRSLLKDAPWKVITLDAARSRNEVAAQALEALGLLA
jgi:hypothetical protein